MTLVLTAASPLYVVQCADRLLTMSAGVVERPADPAANKTILYRASDAVAVIGYSGLAYAGQTPTDEHLAELLWGAPLGRGPDGRSPAYRTGRRPNHWNMGQAERALEAALAVPAFEGHYVGLTIAGWRNRHGRASPFTVEIERAPGADRCTVARSPRRFTRSASFFVHRIGAEIDADALMERFEPWRGAAGISADAATVEEIFVSAIKDHAAHDVHVGADVLSVVLPRPGRAPGLVRFWADRLWPARIEVPGRRAEVEHAGHTPWIIAPGFLAPPSAQVGDVIYNLGAYEVLVRGAPAAGGVLGLQTSIKRPRLSELRRRIFETRGQGV